MEDGRVVRTNRVLEFPGESWDRRMIDMIRGIPWDPKVTGREQGDLAAEQPS